MLEVHALIVFAYLAEQIIFEELPCSLVIIADIVSVRYRDKPDDGPLHDRYWVLIDKQTNSKNGIKLNSISGLGNKESDIATMTNESIRDIIIIWNDYFVDCENKVNGNSLQYEKLYIGK